MHPAPEAADRLVAVAHADLAQFQRQHNRLLRLSFPKNDGPPDALMLVNRLNAHEAMSKDFTYTVEVLSDTPDLQFKELMGKLVTVSLVRDDGSLRHFNGHVFRFQFVKNDAGFSYYTMVLMPWLAFLRHRQDNFIFHGKTVSEQTHSIFSDYAMNDWKLSLRGAEKPMTHACQFNESDYNYLHRRWEALGWHYWYEHRADGHTLMLSDDSLGCLPVDGNARISWRTGSSSDSGVQATGLSTLSPLRAVAPTHYAATSFDFKSPRPIHIDTPTINEQGQLPHLEVHEFAGAYEFRDSAAGDAFIRLRMEEIEAAAKHFTAEGNDRRPQPGRFFELTGHLDLLEPASDNDETNHQFLILEVRHTATNNHETGQGRQSEYRSELTCIRKKILWRPGRGFNSHEPKIYGLQTATVVCPQGEEVHTDEFGRVRVQFHWDRAGEFDERSFSYVRVAGNLAGKEFGDLTLPRKGQEVVVQFLDGNPDRPLITGRVYNEDHKPASFTHKGSLPGNRYITGIKTREVKGERYNQMRLDDTPGEISAQLASEASHTQLNLGQLTHPRDGGIGESRGEGFEIRTDKAGAVRSAEALLISTWKRIAAAGKHLSAEEHHGLLNDFTELFKSLGDLATEHQAMPADSTPQRQLKTDIEGGTQPTLSLTAATGIASTTPKTIANYAGENIDLVAAQHLQTASAGRTVINAGQGVSTFAQWGGIKTIAHQGELLMQSQSGDTVVQSAKDLSLSASGGVVKVMAQTEIVLGVAGGAYIKISGSNVEIGAPGIATIKAADHIWSGPASGSISLPHFGTSALGRTPVFVRATDGGFIPQGNYQIVKGDGSVLSGTTDAQGQTPALDGNTFEPFKVVFKLSENT